MTHRAHRALSAMIAAALLALPMAAPTTATASIDPASGLWWFDRGNIPAAHDAGFDGTGVTVAVIDSQVNPDAIGLRGADLEVVEPSYCVDGAGNSLPATSDSFVASEHGTQVASMIVGTGEAPPGGSPVKGVAPGARLLYYNVGVSDGVLGGLFGDVDRQCLQPSGEYLTDDGEDPIAVAISDAVDAGADIISLSQSGPLNAADQTAKAQAAGVLIVQALPNEVSVSGGGLGIINGAIAVQAFGEDGKIQATEDGPNLSDHVTVAAPGIDMLVQGTAASWDEQTLATGTSYATPIVAGFLAVVKQKYPDATAKQLIQSLIHNTGTKGEHEPVWNSSVGYGAASLTGMLTVDPTGYPDMNPIFDSEDELASPNAWQLKEAVQALAAEKNESARPNRDAPDRGLEMLLPWIIGAAIVLVLLIAGAIVLVVVARRARPGPPRG